MASTTLGSRRATRKFTELTPFFCAIDIEKIEIAIGDFRELLRVLSARRVNFGVEKLYNNALA